MFHVVLHNCKNGIERLESIPLEKRPTEDEVERARIAYGAERAEVIER